MIKPMPFVPLVQSKNLGTRSSWSRLCGRKQVRPTRACLDLVSWAIQPMLDVVFSSIDGPSGASPERKSFSDTFDSLRLEDGTCGLPCERHRHGAKANNAIRNVHDLLTWSVSAGCGGGSWAPSKTHQHFV